MRGISFLTKGLMVTTLFGALPALAVKTSRLTLDLVSVRVAQPEEGAQPVVETVATSNFGEQYQGKLTHFEFIGKMGDSQCEDSKCHITELQLQGGQLTGILTVDDNQDGTAEQAHSVTVGSVSGESALVPEPGLKIEAALLREKYSFFERLSGKKNREVVILKVVDQK